MTTDPAKSSPPRIPPITRLVVAGVLTVLGAAPANADLISLAEFNAGLARAAADLDADRASCEKLAGNPRDVCREQALAKERLTRAELGLARTGTHKSQNYLAAVRLDTAYDIARTRCNDKTGDAKRLCAKQAQAVRTQGLTDLEQHQRLNRAPAEARPAGEKCDTAGVEAERIACMPATKAGGR